MAYINECPPGIKRASLLGDGGGGSPAPMRESLTKRGELVHNLEILSEICPCWFEDGWGTLSYSYLKMVNSFTKNLTENLPNNKGTPPLSTTPMQRGIEIAGAGQDRVGRDA